jgi:hypothetical protein
MSSPSIGSISREGGYYRSLEITYDIVIDIK